MLDSNAQEAPRKVYAKFEEVLFEFIDPLVVLLKRGQSYYIGSAMPEEEDGSFQFLVVSVTPKFLKRYFREENDLRFLFIAAKSRRFFTMDQNQIGKVKAKLVPIEGEVKEEWLPDPQFFASSHTASYLPEHSISFETETLHIDGNWEMEDFGSFSRKLRDLYAFEDSLKKNLDSNVHSKTKEKIRGAFTGKPFQGGSSYVNFFSDLVAAQPREDRFDLKKIEYASPGKILLSGKGDIFDSIEAKVENFVANQRSLHDKYLEFHKYMSDAGLLDIRAVRLQPNADQAQKIENYSRGLLISLKMDLYANVYELSERNLVNTAKITLALYRRLRAAAVYFAQGRVKYGE